MTLASATCVMQMAVGAGDVQTEQQAAFMRKVVAIASKYRTELLDQG